MTNNLLLYKKRARRDLNPRPTEPESVALSTEPRAHAFFHYNTQALRSQHKKSIKKENSRDLLVSRMNALQSGGGDR